MDTEGSAVAIGIDAAVVADHHVMVRRRRAQGPGTIIEEFEVPPTLAGLERLANRLSAYPGAVAVAEPTSMTWLPLALALEQAGCSFAPGGQPPFLPAAGGAGRKEQVRRHRRRGALSTCSPPWCRPQGRPALPHRKPLAGDERLDDKDRNRLLPRFENYRFRVLLHAGGVTWPSRPRPPRIRMRTPRSDA